MVLDLSQALAAAANHTCNAGISAVNNLLVSYASETVSMLALSLPYPVGANHSHSGLQAGSSYHRVCAFSSTAYVVRLHVCTLGRLAPCAHFVPSALHSVLHCYIVMSALFRGWPCLARTL
jgi:hypothetical protein